jgi:hypothetical protein
VPWPASPGPKVTANDEDRDSSEEVERYEALRRRALVGEASGWRLGLAVLERQGVAAWLRAWQNIAPTPLARPSTDVGVAGDELVGALVTMALACIAKG